MSSMNTDCMNFNFIGSLKLLTKKNEKKRNTNTKLNKTNKESAIIGNEARWVNKWKYLLYQKTYSIMNNLNAL